MEHVYEWRLTEPGERLSVHIESNDSGGRAALRRHALAGATRDERRPDARALARYPFLTMRIMARIYSHALRLRLRGARYLPQPEQGSAAGDERPGGEAGRTRELRRCERRCVASVARRSEHRALAGAAAAAHACRAGRSCCLSVRGPGRRRAAGARAARSRAPAEGEAAGPLAALLPPAAAAAASAWASPTWTACGTARTSSR